MDLVIAIKTESKRVVKKTASDKITLLLSPEIKVADKTILHRDKAYLNKLEGTCFKCSKLSQVPPVEVCNTPSITFNPQQSCIEENQYCECYNCHSSQPPQISCLGSSYFNDDPEGTSQYPVPNQIQNSGSGYWVGLQANNFYSNPLNGGWVVAVECSTSEIVGAFPVSNLNFGYGVGTILGYSVMIYPAAVVFGAGRRPFAKTSFPILAQNTQDGDEIISGTGFNLTGPNAAIGTPYDEGAPERTPSETFNYFCNTGPALDIDPLNPKIGMMYIEKPKSCLEKYGSSSCPEFNSVIIQPSNSFTSYIQYTLDIRNSGIDLTNIPEDGVFEFTDSNGNKYCSAIESMTQLQDYGYDALFGICSQVEPVWPDVPTNYHPNCHECVNEVTDVPCQFVNNLTQGSFSLNYGGYNAAGRSPSSHVAIGPSNPPQIVKSITNVSNIVNYEFWERFWDWDHTKHYIEYENPVTDGEMEKALLPPIGTLLDSCSCEEQGYDTYGIFIQINMGDRCDSGDCLNETGYSMFTLKKAGRACVPYCRSCPRNDMGPPMEGTNIILGKPANYGAAKCCDNDPSESVFSSTVSQNIGTSIQWLTTITPSENSPVSILNTGSETPPGNFDNCKNAVPVASDWPSVSGEPCNNIFNESEGVYSFDVEKFEDCSGYADFNNPCFKAKFLPNDLQDKQLIVNPSGVQVPYDFISNIGYMESGTFKSVDDFICGSRSQTECNEIQNIEGPIKGLGLSTTIFAPCNYPVLRKFDIPNCDNSGTTEVQELKFIRPICDANKHGSEYCSQTNNDPCSCCAPTISNSSIGGQNLPTVGCTESTGCPQCCVDGGCRDNGVCPEGPP